MTRHACEDPVPPDGGYGWIVMLGSFGIHIIVDGIAFTYGVLLGEFLDYFGEGKGKTSFVGSVLSGVYLMSGPLASMLVNRFGCRPVVVLGSIISTFGFAICRLSDSIDMLTLTYGFIGGLGVGLMFLPAVISVSCYFEKRRAFATGVAVCGAGVGCFIFAPAGNFILEVLDWKNTMFVIAAITAHGAVLGMLFRPLPEPSSKRNFENNNLDSLKETAYNGNAGISAESKMAGRDLRIPEIRIQNAALLELEDWSDVDISSIGLRSPDLDAMRMTDSLAHISACSGRASRANSVHDGDKKFLCFSARPTVQSMLTATGLNLFKDLLFVIPFFANLFACTGLFIPFVYIAETAKSRGTGIDKSHAVFLLSVIGITNTVGRIVMGFLADLKQVSALMLHNLALLTAGVACLLVRFCVAYWSFVIFALVFGLCIATWISLTSIVLCDLLGLQKLTNSFGLLSLTRGVASLIGPPIAGFVYDWTKNYDHSFMVSSVMFLAGGAICCVLHLPRFQRQKFSAQQQQQPPSPPADEKIQQQHQASSSDRQVTENGSPEIDTGARTDGAWEDKPPNDTDSPQT